MLLRNISLLEEKEKSPISNHRLACAGGKKRPPEIRLSSQASHCLVQVLEIVLVVVYLLAS